MKLLLIRGLPGSGKTTLAKSYSNYFHFESDLFMCDSNGNYCFDGSLLYLTHKLCQEHTRVALSKSKNVVVANTFVNHKEMKPYINMAEVYGAEVEIIVCRENYTSIHGIPESVMSNMKRKWQE